MILNVDKILVRIYVFIYEIEIKFIIRGFVVV